MKAKVCMLLALFLVCGAVYAFGGTQGATPNAHVVGLANDGDHLWVYTTWGMTKLNKATEEIVSFQESLGEPVPVSSINSFEIDAQGNFWFGTDNSGVLRYDGAGWITYDADTSPVPDNGISALAIDGNGNVWAGTLTGGAAKFDGSSWTVYNTDTSGLPRNRVNAIAHDNQGISWFGTNWGLGKYDGENWTSFTSTDSDLPANSIECLAAGADGDILIGTSKGLSIYDGENWVLHTGEDFGFSGNKVNGCITDSNGNVWITTMEGIARYDGTGWTTFTPDNSGLPDPNFSSCAVDGNGGFWLGTLSNLLSYDGTNWEICETGCLTGEDTWSRKSDMPLARWGAGLGMVDGTIYVIGGFTFGNQVGNIHVYDIATDTWTEKNPMPHPKSFVTSCTINEKIYMFAGRYSSSNYVDEVTVYDPKTETWEEKTEMLNLRQNFGIGKLDGNIYLFGGWNSQTHTGFSCIETYDPSTDTWKQVGDLPALRSDMQCCEVDGKFYISGGWAYINDDWELTATLMIYDPATGEITEKSSMPGPISNAGCCEIDGKIYIMGGTSPDGRTNTVYVYDIATDSWAEKASMPTGRSYMGTFVVDGNIYLVTGTDTYGERMNLINQYHGVSLVLAYEPEEAGVFVENRQPAEFSLLTNHPNPFNPSTTITYSIAKPGRTNLAVYDLLGRKVATLTDGAMTPGDYSITWNARGFASGVYFCRVEQGGAVMTHKMLLVK